MCASFTAAMTCADFIDPIWSEHKDKLTGLSKPEVHMTTDAGTITQQ